MKTPPSPQDGFTDATDVDGMVQRRFECIVCGEVAIGFNRWFGGIIDTPTHILILRQRLRAQCRRDQCPHPKDSAPSPEPQPKVWRQ